MPDLDDHRVRAEAAQDVLLGSVHYDPAKSAWLMAMLAGATVGGALTFSWSAFVVFVLTTGFVLLFGHSLGSHRKLIHGSFQCPRWLEYVLVYSGVQVGLAGPLGLLRQHELRDYAQRLADCHPYLRHGSGFLRDGWWQLHCTLRLRREPVIRLEPRIAQDRFYRFLERTWMLQQLPPALVLHALGGWGFVFWGVCARVCAGVIGHWLIGYFAHNRGGMHHEVQGAAVQGRNIPLTALLTMGECWHNNHHAFPGSARLGLYAGEWDPGWWMLLALRRIGLVWGLRLPADLPARAELRAVDAVAHARPAMPMTPAVGLSQLWRLCLSAGRMHRAQAFRAQGPAAWLPARAAGWLTRGGFVHVPQAGRLTLQAGPQRLAGLPALCVVLATRRGPALMAAIVLAPAAFATERLRAALAGN